MTRSTSSEAENTVFDMKSFSNQRWNRPRGLPGASSGSRLLVLVLTRSACGQE